MLHLAGKATEQALDVERALDGGVVVARDQLARILDGYVGEGGARTPEMVDELVARDGVEPRRDRLANVVGVPSRVNRHQRFLDEVLRLRRGASGARELTLEIGPQVGTKSLQEQPVVRRASGETGR